MARCHDGKPIPELETPRLILGAITTADAELMLAVLNDPDFIEYVADRGVRSRQQAAEYIRNRMLPSFEEQGLGMFRMQLRGAPEAIGICGLVVRDGLEQPDLGFALLPQARGGGLVGEAARAVLHDARQRLGMECVSAITDPANAASIRVLESLGFSLVGQIRLPEDEELLNHYQLHMTSGTGSGADFFPETR